ncbi:hypothetical protein HV824_18365 [Myxococcus sp. AM009]|uniref:hypothetical protein n=1 Tax=Myxococcus sp. AM009 TaxID=2745137 RepID=UPI001595000E|nr:hypothetical protein [Myxococcus sp. AM009]NVJ00076.1 hypothetical protein [Myxococcus sp. AM009]
MSKVFDARAPKHELPLGKKTLGALLDEHDLTGKLDEVALYNWGTRVPAEINRALVELVGCAKVDADPLQSELDPDLGTTKVIYKPVPWQPAPALELEKAHTIKVKRRRPVPAVSITQLTRWFKPGTDTCEVEYQLEGVSARASKVDFEVHATRYYDVRRSEPVVLTQPKEWVEVPCDTLDEPGTTHLFQRRSFQVVVDKRPPADAQQAPDWQGKSEATKGVLRKAGVSDVYVGPGPAPYNVLVRYYQDDADDKARLLIEPWSPRWKHEPTAPLDDASLIVKWTLDGDNDKLVRGQLSIWDKDDQRVFFAPLSEDTLRTQRQYDLLNDPRKRWDRSEVDRARMPYRVQLQAHSGEDEELGLAVAVMPTLVRAFNYQQVQFVAFNVKPGTQAGAYLGDVDDDTDITTRCDAMKEAIQLAAPNVDPSEDVLKVFMAPEFYFRGQKGGYPVDKLSSIVHTMREETDKVDYADWLFVFGTAIGYLPHGEPGGPRLAHKDPVKHAVTISEVDETGADTVLTVTGAATKPDPAWEVEQGLVTAAIQAVVDDGLNQYKLTLQGKPALIPAPAVLAQPRVWIESSDPTPPKTKLVVASRVCDWIQNNVAPTARWSITDAAGTDDDIETCTQLAPGRYELTLAGNKLFVAGKAELLEPQATEVFNVALMQKGWPAPHVGERGLKSALVDKENISWIDFLGPNFANANFNTVDGSGRLIQVHNDPNRLALPTSGSRDTLGARPNVNTEVTASGLGGGSVVTIDGITFGIEVCLDHNISRLHDFYTNRAVKDEPKVQVHLIPSWGSSIGGGAVCAPAPNGPVLNVDGARCDSTARIHDGQLYCDDHPDNQSGVAGYCQRATETRWCGTCGATRSATGACSRCANPVTTYHKCAHPKLQLHWVCQACSGASPCLTHPLAPAVPRPVVVCANTACNQLHWGAPAAPGCGTCGGAPTAAQHVSVCGICGALAPCINHAGPYPLWLRSTCALGHAPSWTPVPLVNLACGCGWNQPPALCEHMYAMPGPCPQHPTLAPQPWRCLEPFAPIGALITVASGPTPVPLSENVNYFEEKGHVVVYNATPIPPVDFVP